ncbi:DUF2306 domain-containing protein [Roseivirga sp.]|uniref:DUF2306 domain-containing protein n=1 Tax=Roseivirga sp. TaxID=1964215 RepID=UPI003B519A84
MVHSIMGLFHLAMALLAMIIGPVVLWFPKGTRLHKRLGYFYVLSMFLLNASAFMIYSLQGRPSIFHLFALISLITLWAGIFPAMKKQKKKGWYKRHYYFMSWSVVGLYCAFWSETGTRLLEGQHFWWVVALASCLTAFVGMILIKRKARSLFSS